MLLTRTACTLVAFSGGGWHVVREMAVEKGNFSKFIKWKMVARVSESQRYCKV